MCCALTLGALTVSTACSREPSASAQAAAAPQAPAQALAPSHAPSASAPAATPADVPTIAGAVAETMDAANYTYVLVDTGTDKVWAASGKFDVKTGDRVVVPLESPMQNFHSQSLNRDFPMIYFASSIWREGEQGKPAMPAGHPPVGGADAAAAPVVADKIAPPEGGASVASVWANRAALAGKRVTVRGKVVKFNGGIMERNWLHIQDGSGAAEDRTNDLTITTSGAAKVGDIITVTGTVAVDKDFGAGYSYAVIVENATLRDK